MAIAGLHNVSVIEPTFLRGSQSHASRQIGDEGRVSTRPSALLQMWRELEDEHVVSRTQERVSDRLLQQRSDGLIDDISRADTAEGHGSENIGDLEDESVGDGECRTWSQGQVGSSNEHEVCSNFGSEHSSDFGEVERGRVRQIFKEWMNCGGAECTSNVSHSNNSSRAEWLGETEQERVRIIREWTRINSQQRGACGDNRREQPAETGNQIERVRDGLVVNQPEGRAEHTRRGIRRLCGRQALQDMLKKAEQERQRELQVLFEQQAVSHFAHRNRIQSLLRGRFLRNGRMMENERPTSMAESELGLLRQRHTVSGLREGFFSRLDNSACDQGSSSHSDTSSIVSNGNTHGHAQAGNLHEVFDGFIEQSEANDRPSDDQEHDISGISDGRHDLGGNSIQHIDLQESNAPVEGWQEEVQDGIVRDLQFSSTIKFVERGDSTGQNMIGNLQSTSAVEHPQGSLQNDAGEHSGIQDVTDAYIEQSEPSGEQSVICDRSDHTYDFLGDVNFQDFNSQVQQWQDRVSVSEERDWEQAGVEYNEIRENDVENIVGDESETVAYDWSQELLENEDRENNHQEVSEVWQEESGFQEAVQSWLEEPSDPDAAPVRQIDTFYFPDDDNAHSTELRELLSRRRVSNLLSSGFRQNLDQLIQSYVQRQGHAAIDWELEDTSASPESGEDVGHTRGYQNEGGADVDESSSPSIALPSQQIPPSPLWDQESHPDNWPQNDMHQRFGIDWEIVNDLRIDMARLQQRMNNLQRMLEACMDMQLELQRSIRQEVSDALNRSAGSQGVCEDGLLDDGSKWDHVRKGICCVCCNSSIDSLLYRCGHMCTCSKCATELVESSGKCPMCKAPAVEVIRAFSLL